MAKKIGGERRTAIPPVTMQLLGEKIRSLLQQEHILWCQKEGIQRRFNTVRFCTKTAIPAATINAFMEGRRVPSILDLREISQFCKVSMEEVMTPVPSVARLNELWEDHRRLLHREKVVAETSDEVDDRPSRYRRGKYGRERSEPDNGISGPEGQTEED